MLRNLWRSIEISIRQWLSSPTFDQDYLRSNFTVADFSEDFEPRAFFEHLLDLAFLYIEGRIDNAATPRAIPKSILSASLTTLGNSLEDIQKRLRQKARTLPRPRSKRAHTNGDVADWESQASRTTSSPSPQTPANGTKRARLSEEPSQPPSPSPSVAQSTAESTASVVTVSMLRDLARSVLKTYKKTTNWRLITKIPYIYINYFCFVAFLSCLLSPIMHYVYLNTHHIAHNILYIIHTTGFLCYDMDNWIQIVRSYLLKDLHNNKG